MREFRETDELDCKVCGACCIGNSSDGDFVPVSALDRKRLPRQYQKKLLETKPVEHGPWALGLKRFGKHEACVALKGTLGKDIVCDVYAQRPQQCRDFVKGSEECLKRRAEVFLVIPTFTV
jgi:Fe-S-cluster containining protein